MPERSLQRETARQRTSPRVMWVVLGMLLLMYVLVGLGYPWLVRSGFIG